MERVGVRVVGLLVGVCVLPRKVRAIQKNNVFDVPDTRSRYGGSFSSFKGCILADIGYFVGLGRCRLVGLRLARLNVVFKARPDSIVVSSFARLRTMT